MRRASALLCVLAACMTTACGFQLRGTADVPFESLYVPQSAGGIGLELKRSIQAGTRAKVVDDPRQAAAILEFTEETRLKEILSLTGQGRVREYLLRYRVGFRVHDGKGKDFVPANTVTLLRDISFNDADVLAKESEEGLLYRDMQSDMVQQILRRLSAARPAAGK
jgi:LPS-assembly lipoprotein